MEIMSELHAHLHGRTRPEDVAECVLRAIGAEVDASTKRLLEKAARGSYAHHHAAFSSMATAFFHAVVDVKPQVELARTLFGSAPLEASLPALSEAESRDAERLERFVRETSALIHRAYGARARLDKRSRFALGLMKGHRWYNKRFRLLVKLEEKIARMVRADRRFDLVRASKSSLATTLSREAFEADLPSACFIAYYVSRMNLRSVFTNGPQDRAYDELAEALFEHATRRSPNWFAIAHAMPDRPVVRHLTEQQRGTLLGKSFDVLVASAELLREVWAKSRIDKRTMIVARGNDSSTWNESAGAWNKARESWISLLHALGMEALLDSMLPGKVMRLMAADVAAWHRLSGGGVHPDTAVFATLPLPWEVLAGEATCSRALVARTCEEKGAAITGWIGPRADRVAAPFRPTPELVHGVTVSSPALAKTLRKLGVFSGKPSSAAAHVDAWIERDEHGFALRAREEP